MITLGIIGVVAALTMPNLIGNYQKKKAVTQLKKSYSVLEQTIKLAEGEYGPVNEWPEWSENTEEVINKYFLPYLSGAKVYPTNSNIYKLMCYDETSKNHGNGAQYNWFDGIYISTPFVANETVSIKLSDGTCIGLNNDTNHKKLFSIDINGSQSKPNVAGKDLFWFYVNNQGFIKPQGDTWTQDDLSSPSISNACNLNARLGGYVCSARIMSEGWEIKYW